MKIDDLFPMGEKPLDRLLDDGGFCGIFRTIGCVGDSLSSGEFESTKENGQKGYHDMFEYSWGQVMARITGSKVYNFSRGGMTAREYMTEFAEANGYWDKEKACQCYIVALGVNDITQTVNGEYPFGDISDVHPDAPKQNAASFCGQYGALLSRLREISPDSFLFLMTIPREGYDVRDTPTEAESARHVLNERHTDFLRALCGMFPNTALLDFRTFAPIYDDAFKKKFYLGGHLNPMGYILTGKMVVSYLDYIIRHNMAAFRQVGFINTGLRNTEEPNVTL